ncbi:POLX protein, partial [Pseudoatta argentina]
MEALLVKSDSWSVVSGESVKPEATAEDASAAATAAAAAARTAWERTDRTAKSDIILAISPSELKLIKGCETSHALWQRLQATYQSAGPARKASLLKKLTLHRMTDGEEIRDHLRGFFDTVDKLGEMEVEINPDLLTIMLLYSLPPAFENFRCAIESRDALPTPEALRIKIIEEADARRSDLCPGSLTPNALAARTTRSKKGQPGQSKSKTKRDEQRDQKSVDSSRIRCFRCKRFGHKAIECGKSRGNDEAPRKVEDLSMYASSDFSPPQNAFEIERTAGSQASKMR